MAGFPQVCFIKNTVSNPQIIIGDYTYYDDPDDAGDFERNVLYLWDKPRHWGGFLVSFPNTEPAQWYIPNDGWHVDFHYTYPRDPLFALRVFTFLSEVKPRGECLDVWAFFRIANK